MPNLLNSVKKHLSAILKDKVVIEGKKVPYFEGFASEKAASAHLIFTAGNITTDRGIFDTKTNRGFRVVAPIYANYRGEKTPTNDKFAQDVFDILDKSLNSGTFIDNYCIKMCSIATAHTSMQDAKGYYIQNVLTLTIEVSES